MYCAYFFDGSDSTEAVFAWWEELLLQKEEFDRARLYFNKEDWDMPAYTINAYYWPYANSIRDAAITVG